MSSRSKDSKSSSSSSSKSSSKSTPSKEKEKPKDEEVRKSKVDSKDKERDREKEREKEKEKERQREKEKSDRDKDKREREKEKERERERERDRDKPRESYTSSEKKSDKDRSKSEREGDRAAKDKERERDKKKSKDDIEEDINYENEKDKDRSRDKNRDKYSERRSSKREEVVEEEEEDEDPQYEDDFEAYDDDFEEEDEETEVHDEKEEMKEVIKAINSENAKALDHRIEKPTTNTTTHSVPVRQVVALSKPTQNSQKQAKMQQQLLRVRELSQLITLEPVLVDLIDLPPLSEYEMYIRSFGGKDTVQVHTQTHEDDTEKEIQTTEIKYKTKAVQFPPSESGETQTEEEENSDNEEDVESMYENNIITLPKISTPLDTIRLSKFLQSASLVVESLLDENTSEKGLGGRSKTFISEPTGTWSTGNIKMHPWKGRGVKQIIFMPGGPPYKMVVVYGDKLNGNDSNAGPIEGKGLLCIWSLDNLENPSKILVLEGKPSYASVSPYSKPYGIFVGTQEGELACWDLRESDTMHNTKLGTQSVRYPTFSTHANKKESHQAPIVCLVTLPKKNNPQNNENEIPTNLKNNEVAEKKLIKKTHGNPLDLLPLGDEDEGSSFPFQIASMDDQGTVNIWVVVELNSTTSGGSEFDLGLSIGGRMKLVKSASIPLSPTSNSIKSQTRFSPTMKSFDLKFNPTDPNEYFVGTDSGNIIHGFRFGNLVYPRNYQSPSVLKSALNVVCLSISPFNSEYFLVGLNTGHICLYNYKIPSPITFWETSHLSGTNPPPSIINIQWSPVRPGIFFAQNSDSTLFIFDLLSDSKGPIITEPWNKTQKNYTNFDFEYHPSFAVSEAQRSKGKKMDQFLATSFNDGHIEIHILHSQFSSYLEGDDVRFKKYLLSL
eukprot:TRINITY_DN3821_c0_g2_i1.p1 TRINITY_DN3821_c0_g2~~TRINITY_DN3821_c0_g2_i1.p1  ORF type:complete len:894 (-),score=276.69 TRINITY_DN3821_c0_g2_i1:56-2737(-)